MSIIYWHHIYTSIFFIWFTLQNHPSYGLFSVHIIPHRRRYSSTPPKKKKNDSSSTHGYHYKNIIYHRINSSNNNNNNDDDDDDCYRYRGISPLSSFNTRNKSSCRYTSSSSSFASSSTSSFFHPTTLLTMIPTSIKQQHQQDQKQTIMASSSSSSTTTTNDVDKEDDRIPTTINQALKRFFLHWDNKGPLLIVLTILGTFMYRLYLHLHASSSFSSTSYNDTFSIHTIDGLVFILSIIFWWIQEYFIHQKLLHSTWNWVGKTIHQQHHTQPYFHISIDSPILMLTWLFVIYFILQVFLPFPTALSAILGYSMAGLGYEWIHYLVHTKVSLIKHQQHSWIGRYFTTIRNLHIRHHLVSDEHYFSFSIPWMDDIMKTNPNTRQIVIEKERNNLKK